MDTNKRKALALLAVLLCDDEPEKAQKKRNIWVRKVLDRREELGCYNTLLRELSTEDPTRYRRWLRMGEAEFYYLLQIVQPLIAKKDTHLRECIEPGLRLALTLRFLATG